MTLRQRSVALAALLAAGCASTSAREIPTNHPAHPAAAEAPAPAASVTLAVQGGPTPKHGEVNGDRTPAPVAADGPGIAATTYTCAHHPEVAISEPGKCPKCGMTLRPKASGGHDHGGHP